MSLSKQKEVLYKDTLDFDFFPKQELSVSQRKRLVFFYSHKKSYRKIINYAKSLTAPNKLCVVFIFGEEQKIGNIFKTPQGNIAVLNVRMPDEYIQAESNYRSIYEKYKSVGFFDKDGKISQRETERYKTYLKHKDEVPELVERYETIAEVTDKYFMCKESYEKYYEKVILYSDITGKLPFFKLDYDRLISIFFPYGIEQDNPKKLAYSVSGINEYILAGINDSNESLKIGIDIKSKESWAANKSLIHADKFIKDSLHSKGFVMLMDFWREMEKPPFGWYPCRYTAYLTGVLFRQYVKKYSYGDTIVSDSINTNEKMANILSIVISPQLTRRHVISNNPLIFKDQGWFITKRLERIFHTGNSSVFLQNYITRVSHDFGYKYRFPVGCIDEGAYKWLVGDYENRFRFYDKNYIEGMKEFFSIKKCKEIKEALEQIDTITKKRISDDLGIDVDIEKTKQYCTTDCSFLLWSTELFERCVKNAFERNQLC